MTPSVEEKNKIIRFLVETIDADLSNIYRCLNLIEFYGIEINESQVVACNEKELNNDG